MHLYVHVPFCDGKCGYCAFYSVPYEPELGDAFIKALDREAEARGEGRNGPALTTIYFGGGTPTALGEAQLQELAEVIGRRFRVGPELEWTVEGSPNTLNPAKIDLLAGLGVNRISVGLQTFSDEVLRQLGRRHSAADARSALEYIAGKDRLKTGCDLIAGLPGVTREQWQKDVRLICELGLGHASVYELSVEDGTRFMREYRKGKLELLDENESADRISECTDMLAAEGMQRYEVSNYSRPGSECRHNLAYWLGGDYLGLGPGAASRIGRLRRTNMPDLQSYLKKGPETVDEETVSLDEDLIERLMYHFRLRDGVDLDKFCSVHKVRSELRSDLESRLTFLCENGLVAREHSVYKPTLQGMDFADTICEVLVE